MNETKISITPETFWKIYSQKLLNAIKKEEYRIAYKSSKAWTSKIKGMVEEIFIEDYKFHSQREFYNIDLIGYETKTDKQQYDWELKIAYEHENDNSWNGELCKLSHIIADLKIISAYYDFSEKEKIEEVLQRYINRIGKKRMFRVPDNNWLFVFGPRGGLDKFPFRAFTINSELQISEILNKN